MAKTDGTAKALPRAKEKATAPDEAIVITIDGREFPLDPGALSALDEDRLRAVTKSRLTLPAVMSSLFAGQGGLSDIAAIAYLAECQAGRAPSWDEIAGSITPLSVIEFDTVGTSDPE